jgi:V8-like Glu-specific endopeptidase
MLLAFSLVFAGLAVGTAASPQGDEARSEHQRIVEYWTPERVQNAIPREVVLDTLPAGAIPLAKPDNPGNGGGGGGGKPGGGDDGGDGTVNGKHWTAGGAVKATTGKVLFTMGSTNYVCSGSVVTDRDTSTSLVLTAGHCTYDDAGNEWAVNWLFYPDFESGDGTLDCSSAPYGCWTALHLITTQGFAGGNLSYDVAFAVVTGDTGQDYQLDDSSTGGAGSQAIAFNQYFPADVVSFGYPHAKPYNGTQLTYCAGPTSLDPFGSGDYGVECKMTGGSSGGPWFLDFVDGDEPGTLVSVNSFKYRMDKGTMYGPYFGAYAEATYNAALNAASNTLVPSP